MNQFPQSLLVRIEVLLCFEFGRVSDDLRLAPLNEEVVPPYLLSYPFLIMPYFKHYLFFDRLYQAVIG